MMTVNQYEDCGLKKHWHHLRCLQDQMWLSQQLILRKELGKAIQTEQALLCQRKGNLMG
jgi:hypothetical protein